MGSEQRSIMNNYKILVVDDVPINNLLVEKMLAHFKFNMRTATNGKECMDAVEEEKPNLILLDLMMPIMDGFEVLKEIKSNPDLADIKIVVLSALNTNEDIVKAYNMGANDFITKPIILEKLVNSVSNRLKIKGLAEK